MSFDFTDFGLFILLLAIYVYLIATLKNLNALHKSYLFFHSSMMLWSLANWLVYVTQNVELQWFFVLTGFYALSLLSFGWLMFSLVLTKRFQGFGKVSTYLWALPALLSMILMTTNPWHSLFARPVDGQWIVRTYGPFYWVFVSFSMMYIFASIGYMLRALAKAAEKDLRRQIELCLGGVVLAVFFSIIDLLINVVFYPTFGLVPGLISLGIFLSAICFVIAIQRYDLFSIISIARHEVLDSMTTAMVVLDQDNVILDSNKSAAKYMKLENGEVPDIGSLLAKCYAGDSEQIAASLNKNAIFETEVTISGYNNRNVSISISPVLDFRKKLLGRVVTLNDVTSFRNLVNEIHDKNVILHRQNTELLKMQDELFEANKKLSEMAITDDLTGCYNRRFLFDQLTKEINTAQRYKHPFTIMVLDLDEFKKINDTYGHLTGDDVLRQVAQLIKGNLRQSDMISRFGGEEFVVYCPVCDESRGLSLARRIKEIVEDHSFCTNSGCLRITVSIGLVCRAAVEEEKEPAAGLLDLLLKQADGALYRAKDLGRNRIVMAD